VRSCEGWKGNAGEERQGSEEQVKEGSVEVRSAGEDGKDVD